MSAGDVSTKRLTFFRQAHSVTESTARQVRRN
jgi:hypothetical protein